MWRFTVVALLIIVGLASLVYALFFWQESAQRALIVYEHPTSYSPGQLLHMRWEADAPVDVNKVVLVFEQGGERLEGSETQTEATFDGYVSRRSVPEVASQHALTLYLEMETAERKTVRSDAVTLSAAIQQRREPIVETEGEQITDFGGNINGIADEEVEGEEEEQESQGEKPSSVEQTKKETTPSVQLPGGADWSY